VQSRVEYQRARRAEQAAVSQQCDVMSAPVVVPATAVAPLATTRRAARLLRKAQAPGQKAATGSLAAIAAIVVAATILPSAAQPIPTTTPVTAGEISAFGMLDLGEDYPVDIAEYSETPEADVELSHVELVLEAHAELLELLDFDRPIAASRSAERTDLAEVLLTEVLYEVLYEDVDAEQIDLFLLVADALTTAEIYLTNEARTIPEVAEEIRIASSYLREALQAFTYTEDDDAREYLYGEIVWHFERLTNALLEAEPSVAVAVPRELTNAEYFTLLVEQAAADAPRLAAAYANLHANLSNGRLPDSVLRSLNFAPNHRLRPDAATQLERLNEAFRLEFGVDMRISDSYRTFASQQRLRATGRGAVPGTSMHGWGLAVDLSGGINRFGTRETRWMRENAHYFGWMWPPGSPWHWEFRPNN